MKIFLSAINIRLSFVILIATVVLFASSFAQEVGSDDNKYAVRAYECDSDLVELVGEDRVEKIMGSTIRICFVPTIETILDGIGIETINKFTWSHGDLVNEAVKDGTTDGILNAITCSSSSGQGDVVGSDSNYVVCVLQSILGSPFYQGTGSIEGDGLVTLTDDARTIVTVKRDIFHTSDENFGEDSGQCITDTNSLLAMSPELDEATKKYQAMELKTPGPGSMIITSSSGLEGSIEEVIVGSVVSISVPEGIEKGNYYSTCMDAGGIVTELPETVLECNLYGMKVNMDMTNSISCLADTDECNKLDVNQVLIDAYALAGIVCGPAPPSSPPSPTMAPPTLSPIPEPTSSPTSKPTSSPTVTYKKPAPLIPFKDGEYPIDINIPDYNTASATTAEILDESSGSDSIRNYSVGRVIIGTTSIAFFITSLFG